MEGSNDELEPLFDYTRVQPIDCFYIEDDCSDTLPITVQKRKRILKPSAEKEWESCNVVNVEDDDDEKEEEDWLLPPPKIQNTTRNLEGDSTIQELRLKKQELASFAQSAEDVLRSVEESVKRKLSSLGKSALESEGDQPSKPPDERAKIVISIQDKDGLKQFRMYRDDKFERLFKMYAEKVKHTLESLLFCFDGDKVSPTGTPDSLGMEDNDIIEVHRKLS